MKSITVAGSMRHFEQVAGMLLGWLEESGVNAETADQILMAIEELFTNIVNYGYKNYPGRVTMNYRTEGPPLLVTVELMDQAPPFNPLQREDPKLDVPIEERKIGGLGIYMVKWFMDSVDYEYKDGFNVIRISKKAGEDSGEKEE